MKHQLYMLELKNSSFDWRNKPIPSENEIRKHFKVNGVDVAKATPQASGLVIVFANSDPHAAWESFGLEVPEAEQPLPDEAIWLAKAKAGTLTETEQNAALAFLLEKSLAE